MEPDALTLEALVAALAEALSLRGWRLATAESCTGGGVAFACTERAGSSTWFERGWVTYSNAAKSQDLGVPAAMIEQHGAVSLAVAEAMARGARSRSGVACALAITGVAGPGGGSPHKPVGTVCFGWSVGPLHWTEQCHFDGDRHAIRQQAVHHALMVMVQALPTHQQVSRAPNERSSPTD